MDRLIGVGLFGLLSSSYKRGDGVGAVGNRVLCGFPQPWSAKSLARAVGTAPSVLRREFQREYGMGVRCFHSRVRLRVALERIVHGGEKIEPVALEVGFRSKKTLYRVVRELTGTTPGGLRDLPPEQAGELVDAAARMEQL